MLTSFMFVVILLKGKKSEMKRTITQIFTLLLLVTLAAPAFAGRVLAEIEYFYSDDGTLIGKAFNGKRVNFEYDLRGQLLAVKDASGKDLERYTYDPAGNRLSKTINGVTTTYTYDKANQLVTSTVNGFIISIGYCHAIDRFGKPVACRIVGVTFQVFALSIFDCQQLTTQIVFKIYPLAVECLADQCSIIGIEILYISKNFTRQCRNCQCDQK